MADEFSHWEANGNFLTLDDWLMFARLCDTSKDNIGTLSVRYSVHEFPSDNSTFIGIELLSKVAVNGFILGDRKIPVDPFSRMDVVISHEPDESEIFLGNDMTRDRSLGEEVYPTGLVSVIANRIYSGLGILDREYQALNTNSLVS